MKKTIVYQGEPGANSHIACDLYDKNLESIACQSFDEVFNKVAEANIKSCGIAKA